MTRPPQRTCLGCRQVKARAALVRLVRRGTGEVVVDRERRAAGRGAWVCPDATCVTRGLVRGRLAHAFRQPCQAGAHLAEEVRGLWQQEK